jgi:proline iminopeptidase
MAERSGNRRIVFTGLAALALGVAGVAWWTATGSTPEFRDADGRPLPGSIAEERRIELGGVPQYVLLRGRDRNAPLLINVHGGPGMSERAFYRYHNATIEDHFVVAYWDQRDAGKNFDRSLDPAGLTIDRMAGDLTELIDVLRAEFGQDKVLLLAHSWGTLISLEHLARRPDTVAAYIGVSQVTHPLRSEREGYDWLLAEAEARGEASIAEKLREIGPPPWTAEQLLSQRNHLYRLNGFYAERPSPFRSVREWLATPEMGWRDLDAMFNAMSWTIGHLWAENQTWDAFAAHPALDVPVYLMLGRFDRAVSPGLAVEWLDQLDAPVKEAIWYERAGHMIPAEDPEAFNAGVLRIAREVGLLSE